MELTINKDLKGIGPFSFRSDFSRENDLHKCDKANPPKLTSTVLKNCENKSIPLSPITSEISSDIPVLVAVLMVELYISHLIKLPEEAYDINNIENKILISSCKFLQGPNVLFINGFIRKKIYYALKPYNDSRYYNLDIPFECTKTGILNGSKAPSILDSTSTEAKYCEQSKLLSVDVSDYYQNSIKFLNKKPFCELVSSKISEQYKYIYKENPSDIKEIIEIDNNMSIILEIQLLQNQQVNIKPYCSGKKDTSSNNPKLGLANNGNVKNKPTIDASNSNDKLDLINIPNLKNESNPSDEPCAVSKANMDNPWNGINSNTKDKPGLDHLLDSYNEPNDGTVDSIAEPDYGIESNINNRAATEDKPNPDTLNNPFNYNDKLDLDYLLNFYSKPDDDFDLIDIPNLENESRPYDRININDRHNFNNLFSLFNGHNNSNKYGLREKYDHENPSNQYNENETPINNKLDFISLLGLFNRSNGNHGSRYRSNPNDRFYTDNNPNLNNCDMTSHRGYRTYNYQSNAYKLLILILCIFILYNLYNPSQYS